ncbi:MAG: hypothetical protein ACRD6I_03715, partial [Candidatus Acidiferrales bacterium]
AGAYFVDRRSGAMHGGASVLQGFHYGFNEENFFLRVDVAPEFLAGLEKCEVVVSLKSNAELRITARLARGKLTGFAVALDKSESSDAATRVTVAFARFLEVRIAKDFLPAWPAASVRLGVALWRAGLPLDLLPSVGAVELPLTLETPA